MSFDITSKLTVAMQAIGDQVVRDKIAGVGREVDRVTGLSEGLSRAWGGLMGGLAVGAIAAMAKGVYDAAGALNDMSIITGMSVERLSALVEVGRTTNTTAEQITQANTKLARSLSSINDEGDATAQALKAIGINYKQFRDLHPDEQMVTMAKAMDQYEDGIGKAAVAQQLLGKSGAEMLPFLKDLAATGQLVSTTTAEQAAMADAFGDSLAIAGGKVEGLKRALALEMLPAVMQVLEVTGALAGILGDDLAEGAGSATDKMTGMSGAAQIVGTVMETLMSLGADVSFVLQGIGRDIGGMAAQIVALLNLDFSGFQAIRTALREDAAQARAQLDAYQQRIVGATARTAEASRIVAQYGISTKEAAGELARLNGRLGQTTQGKVKYTGAVNDAKKATAQHSKMLDDMVKAYERAVDAARDAARAVDQSNALLEAELRLGRELTEAEKQLIELDRKLLDGALVMTDAQEQAYRTKVKFGQALRDEKAYLDEIRKANESAFDASVQRTDALIAEATAQEEANAAFGKSAEQLARITIESLRATAASKEALAAGFRAGGLDTYAAQFDSEAAALRRKAGAMESNIAVEQAKAARDEWQKTVDSIGDGLTDALMRAFERGEGFAEAFRQTLVNAFKTMILEPQLRGLVNGGGNWLGQLMGIQGLGGGAGAGGGGAGGMGNLGALGSVYNTAAGWLGGGGTAVAGYGTVSAELVAAYGGNAGAAAGFTSMAAAGEGGAAAGAGLTAGGASTAASAIPIIGWIIAAIMASKGAYEGGNTLDMLDANDEKYGVGVLEKSKYKLGKALGMSDKWAQILSGGPLTARLLGHKPSATGFGIGSVVDGDFVQETRSPMSFGAATLGTAADPYLQDLASSVTGSVALSASMFGGGLTQGMRFGALTDSDRKGKASALLGFFGADNRLIAGTQTGSGAFGAGGPGGAASKIAAEDLEQWIADQMPVIIMQGLQQSDLEDRFDAYFDEVALAGLSPEKARDAAANALQVATAVAQLTDAFAPVGGVFAQFKTLAVDTFDTLAQKAGGFDALGQGISSYYQTFYSEAERTQDAWGSITRTLNDAGITAIPRTQTEFRALVESLDDLSTEADQKAFVALMKVNGMFAQLTDTSDAMVQRLQSAIAQAAPKFLNPQELKRFQVGQIADALRQDAGLDFSVEQLIGASKDQIRDFWSSFVDLSDGASAAEIAVTNAASALADLSGSADMLAPPLRRLLTTGQTDSAREALNQWRGMQANSALFAKQLASGTLAGGLQPYVDNWWGGAANMPGPTRDGLFNAWMMQTDLGSRVNANGIARDMGQVGGINADNSEAERLQQQQLDETRRLIDSLNKLDATLAEYHESLFVGEFSTLTPEQQYLRQRENLESLLRQAVDFNDTAARDAFSGEADRFLQMSRAHNASGAGFVGDRDWVVEAIELLREDVGDQLAELTKHAAAGVRIAGAVGEETTSQLKEGNRLAGEGALEARFARAAANV